MKIPSDARPVLSLFSGAGGLDTGFAKAGFTPIMALDVGVAACRTLEKNFPGLRVLKVDLSKIDGDYLLSRLDELPNGKVPTGVVGGPPCQAFSRSNGRKKTDDPRAKLSNQYAAMLKTLNDKLELDFFVFENVLGLTGLQHVQEWSTIRQQFSEAGFHIFEGVLDAKWFGVPQERKRVFVVGFNKKRFPYVEFVFPRPFSSRVRTVRQAIGKLPRPVFFSRKWNSESIPFHPNHWCMFPKSAKFQPGVLKEGEIKGRAFRVLHWDEPSWTVAYGHREVHVHPTGTRRLSVYEAMRLQAFPRKYQLCGTLSDQIRLVSDAVPPPLGNAVATAVQSTIDRELRLSAARFPTPTAEHKIFWNSRDENVHYPLQDVLTMFFCQYAKRHARPFPWRKESVSPFQLLVAEVLLKQTKAEAVARIWPQLVKTYPTANALAQAKVSDLLTLLQPLGLHRQRAAILKSLSRELVRKHNGGVPGTVRELLSIPGIGLYSAAAVVCFSLAGRVPIVDANVMRVFQRVYGEDSGKDLRHNKSAWQRAWKILPLENVKLHNYGLLDFAAQVCGSTPKCGTCGLRKYCRSATPNR